MFEELTTREIIDTIKTIFKTAESKEYILMIAELDDRFARCRTERREYLDELDALKAELDRYRRQSTSCISKEDITLYPPYAMFSLKSEQDAFMYCRNCWLKKGVLVQMVKKYTDSTRWDCPECGTYANEGESPLSMIV